MASDCKYPHTHITHITHTKSKSQSGARGRSYEWNRTRKGKSVCVHCHMTPTTSTSTTTTTQQTDRQTDRQTGGRVPTDQGREKIPSTQAAHAPVYLSHPSRNSSTYTPQPHTRIEKYYYLSSSPSPPPSQQPASRHKKKSALAIAAGLPACLPVPTHKRTTLMPFIHLTNGRKRSAKNTERHAVTKESTNRPSTIQAKPSQATHAQHTDSFKKAGQHNQWHKTPTQHTAAAPAPAPYI